MIIRLTHLPFRSPTVCGLMHVNERIEICREQAKICDCCYQYAIHPKTQVGGIFCLNKNPQISGVKKSGYRSVGVSGVCCTLINSCH